MLKTKKIILTKEKLEEALEERVKYLNEKRIEELNKMRELASSDGKRADLLYKISNFKHWHLADFSVYYFFVEKPPGLTVEVNENFLKLFVESFDIKSTNPEESELPMVNLGEINRFSEKEKEIFFEIFDKYKKSQPIEHNYEGFATPKYAIEYLFDLVKRDYSFFSPEEYKELVKKQLELFSEKMIEHNVSKEDLIKKNEEAFIFLEDGRAICLLEMGTEEYLEVTLF